MMTSQLTRAAKKDNITSKTAGQNKIAGQY